MNPPPAPSHWTRMTDSGTSPRSVVELARVRAGVRAGRSDAPDTRNARADARAGHPATAGKASAMSTSLIIDARDRLGWHRRFACEASTAALWGGWLWLWAPLLKPGGSLARLAVHLPPWFASVLPVTGAAGLPLSLVALAGTSGTLVMLRSLPVRRASTGDALPLAEYARHFELPEQVI